MIFVGSTGGRWAAASDRDLPPVGRDERVAVALDGDGCAVEQDPSQLGHVVTVAAGRGVRLWRTS